MIEKLEACSLNRNSLKLLNDYKLLKITKTAREYRLFAQVLVYSKERCTSRIYRILRPLVFNTFINGLLMFIDNYKIGDFGDNKTLNSIQDEFEKQKGLLTSFSPVISLNLETSSQNFLNFSFNAFAILVQNFKAILTASPKWLTSNQEHPTKNWFSWYNFHKI